MSDTLTSEARNLIPVPDCRGTMIRPGERVLLLSGHPHAGRVGTYKGVEHLAAIDGWGCLVRFENDDDGCYVTKANQWERMTQKWETQ
jgi:hypothetical protein